MKTITKHTYLGIIGAIAVTLALVVAPLFAFAESGNKKQGSGPTVVGSTLEVHIGNNNSVLVRGARVSAISGSTITASTAWGTTSMTWTIRTDGTTQFLGRNGETITAATIVAGDYVSFAGTMNTTFVSPTVDAKVVKDWSIPVSETTVSGTVSSVNASGNSLVVTNENGTTTIAVLSSTTIMSGKNTIALSAIVAGDKIKASGSYNATTKTLNATKLTVTKKVNDNSRKELKDIFKDAWGGKGWNWFFKGR